MRVRWTTEERDQLAHAAALSMLTNANHAISMVSFLSHSHDAILKSSKVPYTPVSGGVTQIKHALDKLFAVA